MAQDTQYTVVQNTVDGKSAYFVDTTTDYGTGGNPTYSDIKCIRLLIGNYNNLINQQTLLAAAEMEQYVEYQSLTLTGYTYDNKLVAFGQPFIPFITGIAVASGSQMQETGQYSQLILPATYLPTANYTPYVLTPANTNIPEINDVFNDGVNWATYETYVDNSPSTPSNVVDGTQYQVFGTGATAVYNGNTYRQGEVFIASDSGAISFTGGGTVKKLSGIRFSYFCFVYNCLKQLADLQLYIYQNCICNAELQYRITVMYAKVKGVQLASIQNLTSAGTVQGVIDDVSKELTEIYNQYGI